MFCTIALPSIDDGAMWTLPKGGRNRRVGGMIRRGREFQWGDGRTGASSSSNQSVDRRDQDLSFVQVGLCPDAVLFPALDVSRGHGLATINK